ncbi:hypothetical protein [Candidatus Pelagibacter bacterium nBUS_32]|uniref:hypothetical protein n=1 Tax=Candidatus Pelagibacter bacterium nBUS_32 TaxID=3374192 RepID=UPI003EBDF875
MINSFLMIIFSYFFLLTLNYLLKKNNLLLDRASNKEKHKILLSLNYKVPLSGSFYFFPFIFFFFYEENILLVFISCLFFCIGLLSDLKITDSPKLRLFIQFFLLIIFLLFSKNFQIDTRIDFLNNLMNYEFLRILIIAFFFLVLINGFNFIDGVNNLCSLNLMIVIVFLFLISKDLNNLYFQKITLFLIFPLFVFTIFNFFGKNFLGDGGVYGLSFFLGVIIIQLSLSHKQISPYFLANLLWYPAFENLFSIIRRSITDRKNYLADNHHLHQLLFKYLETKNFFKKKYLLSSLVGVTINIYLLLFYIIGFIDYSDTKRQIYLILANILIYLFIYYKLKKLND